MSVRVRPGVAPCAGLTGIWTLLYISFCCVYLCVQTRLTNCAGRERCRLSVLDLSKRSFTLILHTHSTVGFRAMAAVLPSSMSGETLSTSYHTEDVQLLGRGKFSVVHCTRRRADGLSVALKTIQIFEMGTKERNECMNEIQLLQKMQHPHIIQYLDCVIEQNELTVVMELVRHDPRLEAMSPARQRASHHPPPCRRRRRSTATSPVSSRRPRRIARRSPRRPCGDTSRRWPTRWPTCTRGV